MTMLTTPTNHLTVQLELDPAIVALEERVALLEEQLRVIVAATQLICASPAIASPSRYAPGANTSYNLMSARCAVPSNNGSDNTASRTDIGVVAPAGTYPR